MGSHEMRLGECVEPLLYKPEDYKVLGAVGLQWWLGRHDFWLASTNRAQEVKQAQQAIKGYLQERLLHVEALWYDVAFLWCPICFDAALACSAMQNTSPRPLICVKP